MAQTTTCLNSATPTGIANEILIHQKETTMSKKRCLLILCAASVLGFSSRTVRTAQADCYFLPHDRASLTLQSVTIDGMPSTDTTAYDPFGWSLHSTETGYSVEVTFGDSGVGSEGYNHE